MLVEAYGEHAHGKTQCFECIKKFKSGNFDVRNEDRGKPPKKFEDGSEGCYLSWAAKTWWNCQHESLPTENDRFKSSITRKMTGLSKKATQSHFSSR